MQLGQTCSSFATQMRKSIRCIQLAQSNHSHVVLKISKLLWTKTTTQRSSATKSRAPTTLDPRAPIFNLVIKSNAKLAYY